MNWIKAIFTVLRQGEALSDAKTWKDRHQTINALLAICIVFVPVLSKYGIVISTEDVTNIVVGIATIGGIVTAYLVPATSEKTGLSIRTEDIGTTGSPPDNLFG